MRVKPKEKKFDAVKMMREIRDSLSEQYSKSPELEDKDLERIRRKYGIKFSEKADYQKILYRLTFYTDGFTEASTKEGEEYGEERLLDFISIGIAQSDRRVAFYSIGRSGTGKSTLLLSKIVQDLASGQGLALIDPHGDLAEAVLPFIPKKRQKDLVYLNPADLDQPIGLNVLEKVGDNERHLVAANLMSVFQKLWSDSWGPRMSYLLHNALLALLENPGSTLLGLTRLLSDKKFRNNIVENVGDPVVRNYWEKEFAAFPERILAEVVSPVQNKIGAYLTNRPLRNILGQNKSSINFDQLINSNGILMVNLAKGRIGEEAANLLGSLLVTKLQLAGMSRAKIPESKRKEFFCYLDEFHNLTTKFFATILSESRKYRINFILAHQHLSQLDDEIRDAVLANLGTMVVFRVGLDDAKILSKEFGQDWPWVNLINLSSYEVYYKMLQRGKTGKPYPANSLPPPQPACEDPEGYKQELIEKSRRRYGRPREKVEKKIDGFFGLEQSPHFRHTKFIK